MNRTKLLLASTILLSWFAADISASAAVTGSFNDAATSGAAVRLVASDPLSAQLEFELEALERGEVYSSGERFDRFIIEGESSAGPEGWPELPTVVRMMLVPPRSGVDLRVTRLETRTLSGVNPYPQQPLTESGDDGAIADLVRNSASLEYDGFWPPEVARLGRPAILRGYRIVPVVIHPLRWNPRTRELEIVEALELELDFTSRANMINLVEAPERPRPSRYIHRILRSLVLNPPPSRDLDLNSGSIVYIIGEWDKIEEELQPLVEWRRRMGWTVEVLRVRQNTDRIRIKEAIEEAYEGDHPPEFITLVGDAPGLPGNQFILGFWNEQNGAAHPYETDHHFGTLEGNDLLPEAAVGRLIINSVNMLRGHVNKIIQYESEPYIGDEDEAGWQARAAVAATDFRNGLSSIDVCRWFKTMVMRHGYTDVSELYWGREHGNQPNPTNFIETNFTDGISFFLFRGWRDLNGFPFNSVDGRLNNGGMLPFVILGTCNTGDYAEHIYNPEFSFAERFSYVADGGAIGCIGAAGATHSAYNNLISAGTLRAPFVDEIYAQGWALMKGRLDLYRNYAERGDINHPENGNMEAWLTHFYIFNLMGDPAVDLYTDVPQELEVAHPGTLRVGESRVEVEVAYIEGDSAVAAPGVLACLYKPDAFQLTALTDGQGRVVFNLDPGWTAEGEVQLTVTGHNLMPYLYDFEIEPADNFIAADGFAIDDDNEGESHGDGDGIANPTERIELTVDICNYGEGRPEGVMTATLSPGLPHLEVAQGEAGFEAAPSPGEAVRASFVVDIGGGFPDGTGAVFDLNVEVGESSWQSSVVLPVEGPDLEFASLEWISEPLRPSGEATLRIALRNVGARESPELEATLVSLTRTVGVLDTASGFRAIQPGDTGDSEDIYRLTAQRFHLGGSRADLAMVIRAENGFQDTSRFSIIVDQARYGEPFGPDNYGYICFDDTDTSWFACPTFDWIEIDPDSGGSGTDTELSDRQSGSGSTDESVSVELPFTFRYYGEDFDEVTICSNGWIALGDHSELNSARNRMIPGGEVAPAMICPFWDDLLTTGDGGVFFWHDSMEHLFVVEWSHMQRLGPGNQPMESFEVILFDPRFHPSFSGDGDILFQYMEVEDFRSVFQEWDTPFATVGIGSPDQSDGLLYTYWNELNPGAAPLENGRAILFTTMIDYYTGCARGRVIDVETGLPIENVLINTSYGFYNRTDAEGSYFIEDMLADTIHLYDFTAHLAGYNDSTLSGIEVLKDDTIVVDFGLLHPEFIIDPPELQFWMNPNDSHQTQLTIKNDGNGTLWFTSRFNYILENMELAVPGGSDGWTVPKLRGGHPGRDDIWDPLLVWNAGDTVDDSRIQGITFVRDHWVVAGGANGDRDKNWFYLFDRWGHYLDTIPQPTGGRYGVRDMEYSDGYLYCATGTRDILKLDSETGEIVSSISAPEKNIRTQCITVGADGHLFVSGLTTQIYELEMISDTSYSIVQEFNPVDPRDGGSLRKYGFSWFRDDPDDYNLFIMTKNDLYNPDAAVFKMDPLGDGDIRFLTDLSALGPENNGTCGISITPKWNNMVWVFAVVLNNPDGDLVGVLELGPNASWINYDPRSDTLFTGESEPIVINISTADMDTGQYGVVLEFTHNAEGGFFRVPVNLEVNRLDTPDEITPPSEFGLEQNWPNPFNPVTTINYSIDRDAYVNLSVWDVTGRLVATLQEGGRSAGRYQASFDAGGLPTGVYIYRLKAGERTLARKMVVIK